MPEPYSSKIGLGRKVALLPAARATFLTMYLCVISASAMRTSGWKRRSISPWPGPPTSWWWNSQGTPSASSVITMSERRSPSVSSGGVGAEVGGVGDAARAQVCLGLLGHVARVARVCRARDRIDHVADQRQRALAVEGVDLRARGVGHEQHVRLGDLLKAADRGAVEAEPVAEGVLLGDRHPEGQVLPGSRHVGELEGHP